jgi:pimeloyl-ACP methyl ester carboxylesterase
MASRARLILHDRRGTGLSSRNVSPPNLETRVAELRVVLDAVRSERPVLEGLAEGGGPNVLFAASDPERVHSIVWGSPSARMLQSPDYPWGMSPEYVELGERELEHWGTSPGWPNCSSSATGARPGGSNDSRYWPERPRLYLGLADAFGFRGPPGNYDDNTGAFDVTVQFR